MSKQNINNFNFWCPLEISKAIDENTGEEIMLLGGIASTSDEDSDGEFLDPKGFDIKPLIESGMVNWHHQAKTCPATIVGEPTKAEIRKDGLYIETKLYPSSPIARDIWELAKTLDRDSSTRRLGYSIEGKVLQRKSEDKTSPDFKKITKAVITGVAITHQPKNPKTFANIIKGEIDDFDEEDAETEPTKEEKEYYEGVNMKEKSMDTDSARPLIKEEVDPKIKNQTFGKAEVFERIFQDIPSISIEKAKKVFNLIKNISNMAKRNTVTEDDIQKAYEALGLDMPIEDIRKGGDPDEDDATDDEEVDVEEEDVEEDEDVKKGDDEDDMDDDESEQNETEDEDDTEDDDTVAEKAQIFGRLTRIEKAIATSHLQNTKYIKALGTVSVEQSRNLEKAIATLNLANDKIAKLEEINKAQVDEITELRQTIEAYGNSTPGPKSLRNTAAVQRNFSKGDEDELNSGRLSQNQVSILNKAAVSEILDQATFHKGFDQEFSNACQAYEATGSITPIIKSRIKNEFGIEIV